MPIVKVKLALLASIFDLLELVDLNKIDINGKKPNAELLKEFFSATIPLI